MYLRAESVVSWRLRRGKHSAINLFNQSIQSINSINQFNQSLAFIPRQAFSTYSYSPWRKKQRTGALEKHKHLRLMPPHRRLSALQSRKGKATICCCCRRWPAPSCGEHGLLSSKDYFEVLFEANVVFELRFDTWQ